MQKECIKAQTQQKIEGLQRSTEGSLFKVTNPVDFNMSLENNQKFCVVENWQWDLQEAQIFLAQWVSTCLEKPELSLAGTTSLFETFFLLFLF